MSFLNYINEVKSVIDNLNLREMEDKLEYLSKLILKTDKILICGNGGSAADSQHLATELVVRFEKERKPLKAISLTTDTSILTATSNDYSFEKVFSRQVEAFGEKNDILLCFSTSGNSQNIIEAAITAKKKKLYVVGFLGKNGGELKKYCDLNFVVNSDKTSHIQEIHQMIYHCLCKKIEEKL